MRGEQGQLQRSEERELASALVPVPEGSRQAWELEGCMRTADDSSNRGHEDKAEVVGPSQVER